MKEETSELKGKADSTGARWSEDKTTIQNHFRGWAEALNLEQQESARYRGHDCSQSSLVLLY
jgi:hypothetical protein